MIFFGVSMSAYHSRAQETFSSWTAMRPALGLSLLIYAPLLIGCSIHPLPDDVSRKTTYDIVEKIRCEAKAAVEQYGRGFRNGAMLGAPAS